MYDLRKQRQLSPLALPMPAPSFIRFLPKAGGIEPSPQLPSVLLGSSRGLLQVCELGRSEDTGPGSASVMGLATVQSLFAPIADHAEQVTAVAASPSGHLFAAGTNGGALLQYALTLPDVSVHDDRMLP